MNKMKPSEAEAAAAQLMDQAYAEMENTSFNWLRSLVARRSLVVVTLASAISCLIGIATEQNFVTAGGVIVYAVCVFFGRRAVRLVIDLPDEYLDERLLALRNNAFREAYIWMGALLSLTWLGVFFAYGVFELDVQRAHVYGMTFTLFVLTFSLPTLVYAWRVPRV